MEKIKKKQMLYIDYSPDWFEAILNYVRTGSMPEKNLADFEKDVRFFGPFDIIQDQNILACNPSSPEEDNTPSP